MQTGIGLVEGFRLSPQQRHLWELQRGAGSRPYQSQCTILIEGVLDVELLRSALAMLVRRHEILRTTFQTAAEDAAPVQVIHEGDEPAADVLDLFACGAQSSAFATGPVPHHGILKSRCSTAISPSGRTRCSKPSTRRPARSSGVSRHLL